MGVRTIDRRNEKVAVLDLLLTTDQLGRDAVLRTRLHFGPDLMRGIRGFSGGDTTINEQHHDLCPGVPTGAEWF